jgi:hypothetical protein
LPETAVIWTVAALIETSTIDVIVIEIEFGATAMSSVEDSAKR